MTVPEHSIYYYEIVTPDVDAACELYSKVYGYRFERRGPELGHARIATLPDDSICAIRAPMHEEELPIVRTYLRVADLDAAVAQAETLGAMIALGPTPIEGMGRIAIYMLGGIQQGLWELP